jgi:hypothetical protein
MIRKIMLGSLLLAFCAALGAQDQKQALQEKLRAAKQSMAENKAKLKAYAWVETSEMSLKGEVKKRDQKDCKYGADGKVQKTLIGAPAEPKQKPRGLKGKIVAKKVDELEDYMERFGSLVGRYVPPDPKAMQAAFQAGKASLTPPDSLVFTDYIKSGDKVTLSLDPATKKLKQYYVSTYLDGPEDAVHLDVIFSSLADGTNHVEQILLDSVQKQIQIKTTNFDYKKVGP